MSFKNLKHIFEEQGTNTGGGKKAFFEAPAGGPIPQPYSGNPPNSNLIDFNTNSNTLQKAFFPEIPQPYSGNPPNSNLIDFNSNNDNFPTTIPTNPSSVFNSSSPINSFNTTPINELFSESAFPTNYTPQNTLNADGNFVNNDILANQTWGRLYNDDHTSIDVTNPSPRSSNPFQPRGGGLNIRNENPNFARTDLVGFGQGEPYIVSKIPAEEGGSFLNGRLINFGTRNLPPARALTDTLRIGKYLTSPKGLLNIALKNADLIIPQTVVRKEDKLIRVPQRFNTGYNPLSTLAAVSPIARLIGHGPFTAHRSGFTGEYQATDIIIDALGDRPQYNINDTFTKSTDDGSSDGLFSLSNLGDFFTPGGTVKKTSSGDKMTLAKMIKGNTLDIKSGQTVGLDKENTLNFNVESKKEGMPFYFKDLRDKSYIFFRAYLDGITEAVSPSWAETNYIGRSEPVYVYERATREISFNLTLFAQTEKELQRIYEKMNKLTSLCYPEYAKDEFLSTTLSTDSTKVTKTRMKPPLMKLRMGDLYGRGKNTNGTDGGLIGFLGSLSYTIPDNATYETANGKKVPKYIQAAITYKVIHNEAPNMDTKFYGYHGQELSGD